MVIKPLGSRVEASNLPNGHMFSCGTPMVVYIHSANHVSYIPQWTNKMLEIWLYYVGYTQNERRKLTPYVQLSSGVHVFECDKWGFQNSFSLVSEHKDQFSLPGTLMVPK